jgi:hypothetical protein
LYYAINTDDIDVFKQLLRQMPVPADGMLGPAVYADATEIARFLLDRYGNRIATTDTVVLACKLGRYRTAKMLLDDRELIDDNVSLTGGSLLKLLTGDSWIPDDTDLVTTNDKFLQHNPMYYQDYDKIYVASPLLQTVYRGRAELKHMQYLHVSAVLPFVRKFDLAICRNVYTTQRLVVYSPHALIHRKCSIDVDTYFSKAFKSLEYLTDYYLPRCCSRILKYRRRGYVIHLERTYRDPETMESDLFGSHCDAETNTYELCRRWIGFWNKNPHL